MRSFSGILLFASLLIMSCHSARADERGDLFESKIRPVLVGTCFRCHGDAKTSGGLRIDSRESLLKGGESGSAIVPGKPEESLLIKAIQRQADVSAMPPEKGKALRADQVAAFAAWIKAGAVWPAGTAKFETTKHWSFEPLRDVAPPIVQDKSWVKTSIDTFIRAKQEAAGLARNSPTRSVSEDEVATNSLTRSVSEGEVAPAPKADKLTLIRRATFDLTGLPPTPEEVQAFEQDDSPQAFETVVDRLLKSPAYGERWGRHWLDVVRYADTAGETADYPVPLAWRYRNYVIDSFNNDKPYDEFLREQIAGDVLASPTRSVSEGERAKTADSTSPSLTLRVGEVPSLTRRVGDRYAEQLTATGYLAISRRFGFDSENYHHLTIQDTIDNLGQTVLGLSLGCARCHDHKFDPVSMRDYYALYGIFDSSRYSFPGSEQKQKVRSMLPLLPPGESQPKWREFDGRVASIAASLEKQKQPVPAAILRSLHDLDGDFEMQAPAAGGSNGVLVPPWLYSGKIAITNAAQSPFKNFYPRGKVGASIAAGAGEYRIAQALYPRRSADNRDSLHVNLDFRIGPAPARSASVSPTPTRSVSEGERANGVDPTSPSLTRRVSEAAHRFSIAALSGSPAIEVLISPESVSLQQGETTESLAAVKPNQWHNLQLTLDLKNKTVSGRIGSPGAVTEFSGKPLSPSWSGAIELVALDSLPPSPTRSVSESPSPTRSVSESPLPTRSVSEGERRDAAESGSRPESESRLERSPSLTRRVSELPSIEYDNLGVQDAPIAPVSTELPASVIANSGLDPVALTKELEDLTGFDGDFELQTKDAPPASPWGPGPNSVVKLSANSQSPFLNAFEPGELGIHMPNRGEYDGFGRTVTNAKPNDEGRLYSSFDFRCASKDAGGNGSWRYYLGHGPGNSAAVELFFNGSEFFRRSADAREAVCPLVVGEWYQVQLTLDLKAKTYTGLLAPHGSAGALPSQSRNKTTEFTGQLASGWDGTIDYTFIDSYGHIGGVRPSLDADNFVIGDSVVFRSAKERPFAEQKATLESRRTKVNELRQQLIALQANAELSKQELNKLLAEGPFAMTYGMAEGTPHNVRMQMRGEPDQPGVEVPRGFVKVLGGEPLRDNAPGSGRLELAQWLTRPDNPLTARVMVNRLWQYHFGQGLVKTPNDFGVRGLPPTHPELLDHLASQFIKSGWSVKSMHRLMMLSATYQQASVAERGSAGKPSADRTVQSDPTDRSDLYASFPRRRLSAEEIRDAILVVSGELDPSPAQEHPFPTPINWGYSQHGPFSAVYDHNKRSVYLMTQRLKRHPFLALFDGADPNATTAERLGTTVPTQALFFLNDPFVHTKAEKWASRLQAASPDDATRIEHAWLRTIGRTPTEIERGEATEFLVVYRAELMASKMDNVEIRSLAAYLRTLIGSNEFLHVD